MMKFTVYDIRDCLYDFERTKKLAEAIKKVVKKRDVVVDAGSGSGVLALLALRAGARKVFAIESNKRQRRVIRQNAEMNSLKDQVKVIIGDAKKVQLPEKVNVIICELIHTGTFFEPQMQVINNLKKYLHKDGIIIPERLWSYIELVNAETGFYGLKLSYESRPEIRDRILSERKEFDDIWFNEEEPVKLNTIISMKAKEAGLANAVRITGKLKLTKNIFLQRAKHILMPEIIFLKKPFRVVKGRTYYLHISFVGGADTTTVKIKRIEKPNDRLLRKCTYIPEKILS